MAGQYRSVTDGVLLVLVIILWAAAIDWLSFRLPWLRRVLMPRPLLLVQDGEINRRNMRRELITIGELLSEARLQGIEGLKQVKKAYIEPDGRISIVTGDQHPAD